MGDETEDQTNDRRLSVSEEIRARLAVSLPKLEKFIQMQLDMKVDDE